MRTLNAMTPLVRMRHHLVFATGLLGVIVVGATFMATRQTTNGALVARTQETAGVPVKTAAVIQEKLPLQITAVGAADAYSSVPVNSDVDGQLTAVHVKAGQYVKKRELLFTVDTQFSQADLEQTRANRSEAEDEQHRAEADLSKDRAEAAAADAEADRYDGLYRDGVISKEDDERTRNIAHELDTLVKADQDAIAKAQESVSVAQGRENESARPGYHSIRSPIDGIAMDSSVKPGDTVMASDGTPLVTIEQISPISVSFAVPAPELPDIGRCMSDGELQVSATLENDGNQLEHGTLDPIAYATISENGTASLKVTFVNNDRRLLPGQPVNVVLTLASAPDAAVIPSSAVQTGDQGQYVFLVKSDQTVELRPVVVAEILGDQTILASGLAPGEIVVTDARFPLQSGSRVSVTGDGADTDQSD